MGFRAQYLTSTMQHPRDEVETARVSQSDFTALTDYATSVKVRAQEPKPNL